MLSPVSTSLPIPSQLKDLLENSESPWEISHNLFQRVKNQPPSSMHSFKACPVLRSDPEYDFVMHYFMQSKPSGYAIQKITCIHNAPQTRAFEQSLHILEQEAQNPTFFPQGKSEEPCKEREKALQRWQKLTKNFSPVNIDTTQRIQQIVHAKILPLWHGTRQTVCQSICTSGFTYFGKHNNFLAGKAAFSSTDIGYFGSGIYFTDSAEYATKYSKGHLLLAWVSMREPYAVVSDIVDSRKCTDMKKLGGRGAHENYNAHFIPVACTRPQDPFCLEYYPCYQDQLPAWDEFVVFQKTQTLARFWIELGKDSPENPLFSGEEDYQLGLKQQAKSPAQAFLAYQEAAKKDHPLAQLALGDCYQKEGKGVSPDAFQAVRWYREAAKQGIPEAKYRLALCYHQGKGAPLDYEIAMRLFQDACICGYAPAQTFIDHLFYTDLWMASQLGGIDYLRAQITSLYSLLDPFRQKVKKVINQKNDEGKAPLHLAAYHRQSEVVIFLLEQGANIQLCDNDGYQPLHWAAKGGSLAIVVELLKKGAPIQAKGAYGRTPLHMAVFNSQELVTECLLQNGANINAQAEKEDFFKTPLHDAVIHLDERMVDLLTRSEALDVNIVDIEGHTPLYHAVLEGHLRIMQQVIFHRSWKFPADPQDPQHIDQLLKITPRYNAENVKLFLQRFKPD